MSIGIETYHSGPTNHTPKRVTGVCPNCEHGGRVRISWDYGLNDHDNHRAAALAHWNKHHAEHHERTNSKASVAVEGLSLRNGYAFAITWDVLRSGM